MTKKDHPMKTVVYVHGLNQTHRCFNYVLQNLPEHNAVQVDYHSHQRLAESIKEVKSQLPKGEFALVGHSLGGLICALIASEHPVSELITISAPIAGSKVASLARWFPNAPAIVGDLVPSSSFIIQATNQRLQIPTISLFSSTGHLRAQGEPNDSIVTVSSQKALPYGRKHEVKANHFEILLHERTVDLIQKHLFGEYE